MKITKKALAVMIAAAMLVSFTACQGEDTPSNTGGDTTTTLATTIETTATSDESSTTVIMEDETTAPGSAPDNPEVANMTFQDTRLYAASASILESGVFTLSIESEVMGKQLIARSGENMRVEFDEMFTLIIDGKMYVHDEENDVWYYLELDEDELDMSFTDMFDADALTLRDFGTADFNGDELFFEEFLEEGVIVRYFFDGDQIAGTKLVGGDIDPELLNQAMIITLEAGVGPRLLDVPMGAVSYEEYIERLMSGD
jgi:hypothetical protein